MSTKTRRETTVQMNTSYNAPTVTRSWLASQSGERKNIKKRGKRLLGTRGQRSSLPLGLGVEVGISIHMLPQPGGVEVRSHVNNTVCLNAL